MTRKVMSMSIAAARLRWLLNLRSIHAAQVNFDCSALQSRCSTPDDQAQRLEAVMASINRVEDSFGRPVEFKRTWRFEGHRSRSDAEKEDLAREALEAEGQAYVNDARSEGVAVEFDHVQLTANADQGSDTQSGPSGVRSHKCWGTGVGYLFVRV